MRTLNLISLFLQLLLLSKGAAVCTPVQDEVEDQVQLLQLYTELSTSSSCNDCKTPFFSLFAGGVKSHTGELAEVLNHNLVQFSRRVEALRSSNIWWVVCVLVVVVCFFAAAFLIPPVTAERPQSSSLLEETKPGTRGRYEERPAPPMPERRQPAGSSLLQTANNLSPAWPGAESVSRSRSQPAMSEKAASPTPSVRNLAGMPPPLCPALILPHMEVRFLLDMDSLTSIGPAGSTRFDIMSSSGRKLLCMTISLGMKSADGGSRSLALSSVGAEDNPRAYIANDMHSSNSFRVFGQGGQLYGMLEVERSMVSKPRGFLVVDGQQVMQLVAGNSTMEATANTMNGQQLATSCQIASEEGEAAGFRGKVWRMQASPGVDAVLVCACMVAFLVFGQ